MISPHVYYQLAVVGLLWLCIILYYIWSSRGAVVPQPLTAPVPSQCKRKRSNEPTPFAGLTQRPHCAACAHDATHAQVPPPRRPDAMLPTNRRPCAIDTSMHFCPHVGCDYRGWLGLGNLRANGHPSGGPWRQFYCRSCRGYFLESQGTIFHGKRLSVELIVRVIACLAEGLGIRATARVFEVDPNTVLQWLVEAAEQLQAFSAYFLCDVHVTQLQLDELYAVLRGIRDGEISADQALTRLEPGRPWVWTAMDPESKLLLGMEVGPRTLETAQRVVHQVVQVLAPGCIPLFVTDGLKEYGTALLSHFGYWRQPERRQAKGPLPKPRWMPLPGLRYAQVVKQYRRKRVVGVQHRVVFSTREAIEQVLAAWDWKINTSFVERLNLNLRQRVAAIGRRVNTLCRGEDGLQQQLAVFHAYYNFVLPHMSLRQPLPAPEPTHGTGSAKVWQQCTPAMAAG
jgi:IS1 family transposase